ncbi:MAG TPA: phosphoglucosamine mutase [Bacillota bacterium]|nr:phosphoglucosamine mutase [Bacillota bacterium]
MARLFGTDGIRGKANVVLTPELAFKIGRAAASRLGEKGGAFLIGRDPRLSGAMLEGALASGIASVGMDVFLTGIVTTPGLAWLTKETGAAAGAMISASHNPMEDNGIKFFNSQGFKLEDAEELAIEELYFQDTDDLPRPTGENVGRIIRREELVQTYCDYLLSTIDVSLKGLKIVVDCANGSASGIAPKVFAAAGAQVEAIHSDPDGININRNCGSTHLEALAAAVKAKGADAGLALDGDADRLIAVDARGEIVDGDKIMLICAKSLKEQGRLAKDTLVITVMSNLGLRLAAKDLGIKTVAAKVGDRYVLEEMLRGGYILGGEQSGHIIFRQFATTGDGLLSALQLLQIMVQEGKSLEELAEVMEYLPQVLINVPVASKEGWQENEFIAAKIAWAEAELQGQGRVLVRPSGTEPLIRVMLEGPRESQLQELARAIADVIKAQLG